MADAFSLYEIGLKHLVERLEAEVPHYHAALALESQLRENAAQVRLNGDSENRRADRNRILNELNRLALDTVGASFNELCRYPIGVPSATVTPTAPYVGLRPFRPEDKNLFYGRTRYLKSLLDELEQGNSPILVLNGPSGVGKSSVLAAGLVPRLRDRNYPVVYASILNNPQLDVIRAIQCQFTTSGETRDVVEAVDLACSPGHTLFLIIDQIERCFGNDCDSAQQRAFWTDVARVLGGHTRCHVKLVVAVRADWLYAFQTVDPPLDIPVFSFLWFVLPLTKDEAKEALVGPLQWLGVAHDSDLVTAVLADLVSAEGEVSPPQLQIVAEALYRNMKDRLSNGIGEARMSLEDYHALHGARAILRRHLVNAVDHLGPNAQVGWQILSKLVGPGNHRTSVRAVDLRGNLPAEVFDDVVRNLVIARLVTQEFSVADATSVLTLTHDYLIKQIDEHFANSQELQAWKRAEQYLTTALAEWRDARGSAGQNLVLERERYLHIWSQVDQLGHLSAEANELLLRSGLHHGEPSLGHWLSRLGLHSSDAGLEIVRCYCLHGDAETRRRAQSGLVEAVRKNLVSGQDQKRLKERMWEEFSLSIDAETNKHEECRYSRRSDSDIVTGPVRRCSAAKILWTLRRYVTPSEKCRIAPLVAQSWTADHRPTLVAFSVALTTVVVVVAAIVIRGSFKALWHPVRTLRTAPIAVATMAPDGSAVYLVTQRPIYRDEASLLRYDEGGEWEVLSRNLTRDPVVWLLVTNSASGNRIYVSVKGRGILRTSDDRADWELVNAGLGSYDIRVLAADPWSPDVVYAGSGDSRGVFETSDGGNVWRDISGDQLFGTSAVSLAFTPYEGGALLAGTDDGRIFARKQGNQAWMLVSAHAGIGAITQIVVEREDGQYVYAGSSNGSLLVSTNGGQDWTLLTKTPGVFDVTSITVVPGRPDVVYMDAFGVGGYILWKSEDYGQNWRHVPDDQFTREPLRWLLGSRERPERLYAAGWTGLFDTQDGGESWTSHQGTESPLASIDNIAISPVKDGPIYTSVAGTVYSALDLEAGEWIRGRGLLANIVRDIAPDPDKSSTAYAAVFLPNKWSVFVTLDAGKTWDVTASPQGIPEQYLNDTMALDTVRVDGRTVLYAGTNGCGVFHTTDGAASWETWGRHDCVGTGIMPHNVYELAVDTHRPSRVYVVADSNRFFVSEDGGQSWRSNTIPLTTDIVGMGIDPVIEGRIYLVAGASGFWRSDDGGVTWDSHSSGLEGRSLSALTTVPGSAGTVFVGATTGEMWRTSDGGQTWQSIRENLAVSDIVVLAYERPELGVLLGSLRDGIQQYSPSAVDSLWPF